MTYQTLLTSLLICCLANPALAGKLDDLETQATTKSKSKSSSKSSGSKSSSSSGGYYNNSSQNDDDGNPIEAAFMAFMLIFLTVKAIELTAEGIGVLAEHGGDSFSRYDQSSNTSKGAEPSLFRKEGDPILPTLRLSSQWLNGSGDVSGQLNRIEAGFGAFGVSHTQNRLTEAGDKLTIKNTLAHYRMSFGNDFSWDLAFGKGKMDGNKNTDGNVFAMPMRLRLNQEVHLEYFPVWSDYGGRRMSEHQFSLNWQKEKVGLSTGFKTFSAGNTSVNGLFAGLYVNF